jgi:hypothetical protein
MPAIENQQTGLAYLIKINGTEVTEHGRTFSSSVDVNSSDVLLNNGTSRRYIKTAKNSYSLSFNYLPNNTDKTIDGRVGRDFLVSLMSTRAKLSFSVKLDPNENFYNTNVYADSYSETLVRRDMANSCSYYNIQINFKEA